MRARIIAFLSLAGAGVLACGPRPATAADPDERGTLSVVVENDVFFSGSDRNYTNGVKASYLYPLAATPGMAKGLTRFVFGDADRRSYFGLGLGQSLFTPEDIGVSAPLPDQHPYAGWLYLEGTFASIDYEGATPSHADLLTLQLGVVGESALGEEVQRNFHKLIDGQDPRGWDNQLHDEPGLLIGYDRIWRRMGVGQEPPPPGRFGIDATPSLGVSVGNIATEARAGIAFRAGTGLAADFGPPRIRPSLTGVGVVPPSSPEEDFTWYVFAGLNGKAVAHSIFLDGNTFRDSFAVDRRPFVGEAQFGVVVEWAGIELAYTLVTRTEEFETQDEAHQFGALSLSVGF